LIIKVKSILKRFMPLSTKWAVEQNQILMDEIVSLRKMLASLQENIDKESKKIDGSINMKLEKQNERLLDVKSYVAKTSGRTDFKIEKYQKHLHSVEDEIKSQLVKINKQEDEIKSQLVKINKQEDEIKSQLVKINKQEDEIKSQLAKINKREDEVKSQLAKINKQEDEIKSQLAKINKQEDEIKSQLAKINKREDEIKSQLVKINKQEDEIKSHTFALKKQSYKTESQITKISQNIKFIEHLKDYDYYKNLNPKEYQNELKKWYKNRTGKRLNLDNPQTFNDKINWIKLHDSTPIKTKLADKYEVREWVKEKIGEQYLIPLLGVWDSFDEIDFDALPNKFVLKCTHGCGWNIIVKDKSTLDLIDARSRMEHWLNVNFAFWNGGLQLHYKDILGRIIAEEYLENKDDNLFDYKIYCFGGTPKFIRYSTIKDNELVGTYYDLEWNRLPFTRKGINGSYLAEKPENLNELIDIAATLSYGFNLSRVDLYLLRDGSIKFGEITFTPNNGQYKWDQPEYDLILGQQLQL